MSSLEKCLFRSSVFSFVGGAFPGGSEVKASACNSGDLGLIPGSERSPLRKELLPTPVFLPGEFHGQRSLVGYSLLLYIVFYVILFIYFI